MALVWDICRTARLILIVNADSITHKPLWPPPMTTEILTQWWL
jgi:hypothetical protein